MAAYDASPCTPVVGRRKELEREREGEEQQGAASKSRTCPSVVERTERERVEEEEVIFKKLSKRKLRSLDQCNGKAMSHETSEAQSLCIKNFVAFVKGLTSPQGS